MRRADEISDYLVLRCIVTALAGPLRRFVRWINADVRSGENTDLWILAVSSVVFTFLGAFGVASVQVLASVILALLSLVAISQIRSRHQISTVAASVVRDRTSLFQRNFPEDYNSLREYSTHSYFFAGLSMQRTLPIMRVHIERILDNGGLVRVLLPNPDNAQLMTMISKTGTPNEDSRRAATNIRYTIDLCAEIARGGRRPLVRTVEYLPRLGINALDLDQPGAIIMIQMYQFMPQNDSAPIFTITRTDGHWFDHFHDEIERLWAHGKEWNLATSKLLG